MKNFIEVHYANHIHAIDYHVSYGNFTTIEQLYDEVNKLQRVQGLKEISIEDALKLWLSDDEQGALLLELIDGYDLYSEIDYYTNIFDVIHEYGLEAIDETITLDKYQLELFAAKLGYQHGTVGYSPWTYYIAAASVEYSLVSDIYEGYNFYDLVLLDEKGLIVDSIGEVYAPTTDILKDAITSYLVGDEPFYIVDNSKSKYIDLPKARKFVKEYEFTIL